MMTLNPERSRSTLELLARTRALLEVPWGEAVEADPARLQRRAMALARERKAAAEPEAALSLLLFRLGEESYGLDLAGIEKVLAWRPCASLPGAPAYLTGVADVNGEIISIIDLGRLLALPSGAAEATGQLILLGKPELRFALHVAGLEGIRQVALKEIQPPPVALPAAGARYLLGVTIDGVLILDPAKLNNAPELNFNQEP